MTLVQLQKKIFLIECKGRDSKGGEVLQSPVKVEIEVVDSPSRRVIHSDVKCPYNTGMSEGCLASKLKQENPDWVHCPYNINIPYALFHSPTAF